MHLVSSPAEQQNRTSPLIPSSTPFSTGLSWRAILLSLFLAAMFGFCIPIVDFKMSNTFLGAIHMPAGAVAVLLVLLLVLNPLLGLISKRLRFTKSETLTVYISCLFSCVVPGRGAENFFIPNILSSFYFATRENQWLDFLSPYLKPWLTPALKADKTLNEAVVKGWYESGTLGWGRC